jgi:hypothetical protein
MPIRKWNVTYLYKIYYNVRAVPLCFPAIHRNVFFMCSSYSTCKLEKPAV